MDGHQQKGLGTARLIWIIGSPILFTIGVIGNIMTIVVLCNKRSKTSSSTVFLMFLAVADFLVMTILLPRWWIIYVFAFDVRHYSNWACKLHWFFTYFSGSYSCCILTAVTIERIVCTIKPHKSKYLCTVNLAVILSLAIMLALTFVHGHVLFGLELFEGISVRYKTGLIDSTNVTEGLNTSDTFLTDQFMDCNDLSSFRSDNLTDMHDNTTFSFICQRNVGLTDSTNSSESLYKTIATTTYVKTCWYQDKEYGIFFEEAQQIISTIFYTVIPGGTFIVGAVIIISKLRLSKQLRTRAVPDVRRDQSIKSAQDNNASQITFTLMLVNVFFFVSTTPAKIFLIGRPFWVDEKKGMTELQEILWAVVNQMWYSNHAVNFILYFLCGSRFRQQVRDTFSCKKTSVRSRSYTQSELSTNESGFSSKYIS